MCGEEWARDGTTAGSPVGPYGGGDTPDGKNDRDFKKIGGQPDGGAAQKTNPGLFDLGFAVAA